MLYKQIIAMPAQSLREMSYAQFEDMFKSTTSEIEILEAAQDRERKKSEFVARQAALQKLYRTKDNLTYHRHYVTFCDAQDKKYYDSVYHRALPQ